MNRERIIKNGELNIKNGYSILNSVIIILFIVIALVSCGKVSGEKVQYESKYLKAVQTFAGNVLENGRDNFGEIHSPLFADGLNVKTGEPVRWEYEDHSWIISNFASQQNLMRVFVGLSALTKDDQYRDAVEKAVKYMFENHTDKQGLMYWGGHQFVDLQTMENQFEGRPHELKNNYPFYEFMWEIDSAATRKMLRAMWNAHILDWGKLDLNRHGEYDLQMGKLWSHDFEQPEPFFEGSGLTFINAGTDMIQAALSLYMLDGEEGAKIWGLRLYEQYVNARHPETNLGVYQYSQAKQKEIPPSEGPLEGEFTFSKYGDRAANQFGAEYGEIALEGNVLWGGRMETLYGKSPVMILHLADQLKDTETGEKLLHWALQGLRAYAHHAYISEKNEFRPMWANGKDLSGQVYPRTGYYGKKGTPFKTIKPNGDMMFAAAKAVRLSEGDSVLWNMIRHMFLGKGLGDPGKEFNSKPKLNLKTDNADATILVTVLELYKINKHIGFLNLAESIGNNILDKKFEKGYFRPTKNHVYTRFDSPEPLALLMLEAARQDNISKVPAYLTGYGSTDGEPDNEGRPSDEVLYEETYN